MPLGLGSPSGQVLRLSQQRIAELEAALTDKHKHLEAALTAGERERAVAVQELEACSAFEQQKQTEYEAKISQLEDALEDALASLALDTSSPNLLLSTGQLSRSLHTAQICGISPHMSRPKKWALKAIVQTHAWKSLLWQCVRTWRQEASVNLWCTQTLQILQVTRSNSPERGSCNQEEAEQLRRQLAALSSDYDHVVAEASSAHAILRELEQKVQPLCCLCCCLC